MRLSSGCKEIDTLLGGGIEHGVITEIYGAAGTGKTTLCILFIKNCILGNKKVIYIDTEGISFERIEQICCDITQTVLKNVLFFEPHSWDEQDKVIDEVVKIAENEPKIGLVVFDSLAVYYRYMLGTGKDMEMLRLLSHQLTKLFLLARKKVLPVIITNQVYTNIETQTLEPVGGQVLRHLAKIIICLEREGKLRKLAIIKHRSLPEKSIEFMLVDKGIDVKKKFI